MPGRSIPQPRRLRSPRRVKIEDLRSAIVVFNPDNSTRTDLVDLTLELPPGVEAFDLLDEYGAILPYQAHGLGSREIIHMILDAEGLAVRLWFHQ